ncbi:MAG: RNA signal recognition particle [Gammaproteobacteria bacterium]|nr:MAG: RNA signal recognition particle [Gammaproteobacteria bacterium]
MYINAYILSVPEEKKNDYIQIAKVFAEVAKDFGVIEIFENWEVDVPDGDQTDYRKAVKAEPGEKIVMSWTVWPDKNTCDEAHKGMFEDERFADLGDMPFDGKRMILGAFEPILTYKKTDSQQ